MSQSTKTTVAQWVVLVFVIAVVGVGMFLARNDPDTDWGPIILGGLGLIGFMIRSVFKLPSDSDEDGYPK